jgi:hypothetical protein
MLLLGFELGSSNYKAIMPQSTDNVVNLTLESAMCGVILEHVDHVVKRNEGIIDGNNLSSFGNGRSQHQATNAAKSIDSNLKGKIIIMGALKNYLKAYINSR